VSTTTLRAPSLPLRFLSDPGHAWLPVSVSDLAALGLVERVSGYSYLSRDGLTAYLEEDCDAPLFLLAAAAEGWDIPAAYDDLPPSAYDDDSAVRRLPHYDAGTVFRALRSDRNGVAS
jgi:hypothetical protein